MNPHIDEILGRLEWCKVYSYCTGWASCPICGGIKPGDGRDESGSLPDNSGHRPDCGFLALRAELLRLGEVEERLEIIRKAVSIQADDDGLWFMAKHVTEAYLQQELRELHRIVEGESPPPAQEKETK